MPTTTPALPPRFRVWVYAALSVGALVVGACQIAYATLEAPAPDWLTVSIAVLPYLAAGLGYTAATHTPSEKNVVQPAKHIDGDGDGEADYDPAQVDPIPDDDERGGGYHWGGQRRLMGDTKADAAYHPGPERDGAQQ